MLADAIKCDDPFHTEVLTSSVRSCLRDKDLTSHVLRRVRAAAEVQLAT